MEKEKRKLNFSDDETITKAIKLIRKGITGEKVQKKLKLTDDDLDLIDFIINEL
jgi:hypothetical protein